VNNPRRKPRVKPPPDPGALKEHNVDRLSRKTTRYHETKCKKYLNSLSEEDVNTTLLPPV